MSKLTNKKYVIGTKKVIPLKKRSTWKNKVKPYKGMDTGRGYIALEETQDSKYTFKEKFIAKVKRIIKNVRFIK